MNYGAKGGHGYGNNLRKVRQVQARRSDHAKEMDSVLKAPKSKNVDQWLSAPNLFDLPTVDENKPQKSKIKSQELPFSSKDFTRLIDKDFINKHPETQKAFKEILKKLANAEIPYAISEENSISVSPEDYLKADKLTDTEARIIYKNRNYGFEE